MRDVSRYMHRLGPVTWPLQPHVSLTEHGGAMVAQCAAGLDEVVHMPDASLWIRLEERICLLDQPTTWPALSKELGEEGEHHTIIWML